jgi:hypothetical protein
MGIVSSFALFCPVILILLLRLGTYRTFPALLFYYSSVLVYNLMTEGYIPASPQLVHYWGFANNLLDAPLMLGFLIYFSTSPAVTRRIKMLITAFILFELIVVAIMGITVNAITVILGPGILLVITVCLPNFIRHTKIVVVNQKATGKILISAALLFAYGCYAMIYVMYYIFRTTYVEDTFLIYFLSATLSALILSVGIILEEKRIRKLNELKQTRKELSDVYATEKKAAPIRRTAMLDFDREQWN